MATKSKAAPAGTQGPGIRGIETRSIDWVPDTERHGKAWQQAPLWFLGNFQYFTIPIGFIGPSLGLSLGWTIVAGTAGRWPIPAGHPGSRSAASDGDPAPGAIHPDQRFPGQPDQG